MRHLWEFEEDYGNIPRKICMYTHTETPHTDYVLLHIKKVFQN